MKTMKTLLKLLIKDDISIYQKLKGSGIHIEESQPTLCFKHLTLLARQKGIKLKIGTDFDMRAFHRCSVLTCSHSPK